MTVILVTHDPNVARRTHRILMMRDGKIVQEDIVGDTFTEDLKVLARSVFESASRTPHFWRFMHSVIWAPPGTAPSQAESCTEFYDGVVGSYTPSLPEWLLGLGGVGMVGVIVALALKWLAFLPQRLDEFPPDTVGATTAH
jgi:Ni/Fe-hydrogenase subunit HybB-like protein